MTTIIIIVKTTMNIVLTKPNQPGRVYVHPIFAEHFLKVNRTEVFDIPGLKYKYCIEDNPSLNDHDSPLHQNHYGAGYSRIGPTEFSEDDQIILLEHFSKIISKKDQIVIVEIGVCRNDYHKTSTSIFIDHKRDGDIYLGIDIEDKSYLNNREKNVYTLKTPSENIEYVSQVLNILGVNNIDVLMIDGWHSINQVYKEWEYTRWLSNDGIVVFHDTNAHPGPYFIAQSIDTDVYEVKKYLNDVVDWGITVATKKQ
jgi:cephalosporin hydroxylase